MKPQQLLNSLWITGVMSLVAIAPVRADVTQVTGVRLNQTPNGIEIILETPNNQPLTAFSAKNGRTFVTDIITSRLAIPQGNTFRQDNPAEGIASVTVTQRYANTIQVKVIATNNFSEAQVFSTPQGLEVSLAVVPQTTATRPSVTPVPGEPSEGTTTQTTPGTTVPDSQANTPATPASGEPGAETPPGTLPTSPSSQTPGTQPGTQTAPGQPTAPTTAAEEDFEDIEIVVTATRTAQRVTEVPRSVTVINRQQIEEQGNLSRDLQDILANTVPGLSPSSQLQSSFGQSLRGRRPQILIDGVPISSNNASGFARDLRSIDPGAVERIEVVRGASAAYGAGATGGVINIITRRPTTGKPTYTTEVGINTALSNIGDSLGYNLQQSLSGKEGQVDYTLSGSLNTTGDFFDAEGDRIPLADSGTQNTRALNFLGKVGLDLDPNQRLQLSANYFNDRQSINFLSDPIVNDLPGKQKARAFPRNLEFIGTPNPGNQNTVITLDYNNRNLFNGQLQGQLFFANTENRGSIFDNRVFDEASLVDVARTRQNSQRLGGRLQFQTPLAQTASLLVGVDYLNENASEIFDLFDPADFDNSDSSTLRKINERVFAPDHQINNLGFFAQGEWDVSDRISLSGGIRYERIGFNVPDFFTADANNFVEGGSRNFNGTVFNVGAVYNATEEVSVFTNFAQGFSIPSLSRILYYLPAGFSIDRDIQLTQPQTVNNYEIGVKGNWQNVQASLAAFYSTSDLDAILQTTDIGNVSLSRAPRRTYGVEATVDVQPTTNWRTGGTFSWTEGEYDPSEDGSYIPLDSSVIQPLKLTAYVENQTSPTWRNRLQTILVGSRDRAFNEGIDAAPINSYLTVDYISGIKLGQGELQIGVQNLLNNQYYPVTSQWLGGFADSLYTAGRGRTVTLGYRLTW